MARWIQTNLKDSVTKRRSQMGLLDTDSTSDDSLGKLWDNKGDIASQSYAEHAGPKWGVTFSTPNNEKFSHDQFVVVHKHVDALQEELGHSNYELSKHLKDCEYVNGELCNKLTMGLQDMDTKFCWALYRWYICQRSTTKCWEYTERFKWILKCVHFIPWEIICSFNGECGH